VGNSKRTVPFHSGYGAHDTRDEIVDYVRKWSAQADLATGTLLKWIGVGASKFYDWRKRYGQANEHNGPVPRDWWLEAWERQAILDYHDAHPLDGYRRLAFMMLDDDVVAVSPSSVYRVLKSAGRLDRRTSSPSKKGTGFVQPPAPHKHWHVDISYLNLGGTFYYLCSILGRRGDFIVHFEIRESMTEQVATATRLGETSRRLSNGRERKRFWEKGPARRRESSATTGRSSSPKISSRSFGFAA